MTTRHISKRANNHKPALTAHIAAIRQLGKQTIANVIEIGRRLTECKDLVGHRNFGNWLDREFGWSERTARNFMRVHELSESKSENFSDLDLPVSALYLLAAPSTPAPVREEILERGKKGEKLKHEEVKQEIAKARKPRGEAKEKVPTRSLRGRPRPPPREYELKIVHGPTYIFDPSEPAQFLPKPAEQAEAVAPAQQDVGSDSTGAPKLAHLESEVRRLELRNIGLESELEEVRKPISVVEGKGHHCAFCRKSQPEVFVLISAPANTAFICDQCIDLGANLVRERRAKASVDPLTEVTLASSTDDYPNLPPCLDRRKH
jgi:hypothetical protein